MNKKVISSVLAGAMAVSTMGIAASAAVTTPKGNTTEGNLALSAKASMLETTINADLPQDLETFINPYGAAVSTTATTAVNDVKYSDGLISPTYSITNYSETAGIKVSATAKITPSGTVAVNTKALDDVKLQKATEKQVFAFLNTTTDAIGTAADKTAKPVFANTKYVGNDQQLAFTEDGAKATGIMSIPAVATENTAEVAGMGWFYVGGQCTPNPEEAWTSKDTVTVDLILDLSPTMGDPADLTLKGIEITGGAKIEFDAATTNYTIAASGSKTKAASIAVTSTDTKAKVYVKYNGKLYSAASTSQATDVPGSTLADGSATVTPPKDAQASPVVRDYAVGDVLEFIVVNAKTNESATYTITFE